MKSIIKKLSDLGVTDEMPAHIASKITLSNWIVVILVFLVVIPFIGLSVLHFPQITYIPIIGFAVCFIILGINAARLTTLARFLISILPVSLAIIYVSFLAKVGEPKIFEMYAITLRLVIIPFLVFDLRERLYLLLCGHI